jgi:predicted CopG family antitoxin
MISPSDEDYRETKRIKQGQKSLSTPFQQLANWISRKYTARVLNIRFEHPEVINRPRLHIIFEYQQEAEQFNEPDSINYDARKQQAVADAFQRICQPAENLSKLFVIFSSFAPAARKEANMTIPVEDLQALKQRLDLDELWKISRHFSTTDFMLYTDQQVKRFKKNGMKEKLSQAYFELLKPHDAFNYFDEEFFSILLGSKEDFDKNYDSNWYYYYK